MKQLNEKSIEVLKKLIEEEIEQLVESKEKLDEAPIVEPQPGQQQQVKPKVQQKPAAKPAVKPAAKPAAKPVAKPTVKPAQPVAKPAPAPAPKPPKTPQQKALDAKRARPPKPTVKSDDIARVQYQIFAIKMAMSRLDTKILSEKFMESLHDFDLNISKNDKDAQKITGFILPVIGNIEALKNAVESLQIEFNKLKTLLDRVKEKSQ